MKKIYALFFLSMFIAITSKATIHTVTVANFSFSPSNFSANVGDTIRWVWQSGDHTTTSTTLPSSANSWNHPMSSSSTKFDYKVLVPGSYNFQCNFHPSMQGSFTVSTVSAINDPINNNINVFPIPFYDKITVTHGPADVIQVSNSSGEKIISLNLSAASNETIVDLPGLPVGIYFLNVISDGKIISRKKIIKLTE